MADYLPPFASAANACAWLSEKTNQPWPLVRVIEEDLMPSVWIDWSPGMDEIFGDRSEGFRADMVCASDTQRLACAQNDAVLTMTRLPDGRLLRLAGLKFPLDELMFRREDLEALAVRFGAVPAPVIDEPKDEAHDEPKGDTTHRGRPWKAIARRESMNYIEGELRNGRQIVNKAQVFAHTTDALDKTGVRKSDGAPYALDTVRTEALGWEWWADNIDPLILRYGGNVEFPPSRRPGGRRAYR